MVVKRRLLLAIASALTLMLILAAPMTAATREATPSPLRAANLLRLKDVAANGLTPKGAIVAVGYQEGGNPGQLYLAFSTNGGKDYARTNGNLRRYPIVGVPNLGLSIDICAGRVWVASAYHAATDKAGDSDVFLTSRTIGGGAAQAVMTRTRDDRRVRDVTVSCVGNDLIAVGWLQRSGGNTTAQLLLRTVQPLGAKAAFQQVYDLGDARLQDGLDVATTPTSVAVAFVREDDLRLKRFDIAPGTRSPDTITSQPLQTIAWNDVRFPRIHARGKRLAVAFTDAGKLRVKASRDLGATFVRTRTLAGTGSVRNPSRAWSIDLIGDRIVSTAGVWSKATGKITPTRMTSSTFGERWSRRTFGNIGARNAALLKRKNQPSALVEAWHNNAPKGSQDTLRARYELP